MCVVRLRLQCLLHRTGWLRDANTLTHGLRAAAHYSQDTDPGHKECSLPHVPCTPSHSCSSSCLLRLQSSNTRGSWLDWVDQVLEQHIKYSAAGWWCGISSRPAGRSAPVLRHNIDPHSTDRQQSLNYRLAAATQSH